MNTGTVFRATGSWYDVSDGGRIVQCRLRGKIRLQGSRATNPVVVGDIVDYEFDDTEQAVITAIHPRRNYIIRRASNLSKESHVIAANIDLAVVIASLAEPTTSYEFIDRFLVTCEAYHIPAIIALNKIDIARMHPEALDEFRYNYTLAGYQVVELSATSGEGVEALRTMFSGKTTLLSGNSGVGKSSLIKAIHPDADIRISAVSESHHKGRHTTTFSQVYPLTGGGFVIDTPGIKGFGLIDIDPRELCRYFPDLMRFAPDCRFYNCTHNHEPGCAVEDALEQGMVSPWRYDSYLKMLEGDEKYR